MIKYREIQPQDNEQVCNIIRTTLEEFGGKKEGTAYYDTDTEKMFEAYQKQKAIYYVALIDDKIVGGCGIQHLANIDENIAELQKLYLLKSTRGLGIGKKLVEMSIEFAKKAEFDAIYIETFPNMDSAKSMYSKFGFEYINQQMGGTGHSSCNVRMLKKL